MTIFLVFLLLLSPPAIELMAHARRVRERALAAPLPAHAGDPAATDPGAGVEDVPAWSALDDHQLTRLLVSSTRS